MIEIIDGRYFVMQYFVPGEGSDFMGMLYRDNAEWVLHYRFRYYASDDPHDYGEDVKNWYTARVPTSEKTEAEMIDVFDRVMREMLRGYSPVRPHGLMIQSADAEEVGRLISSQPYSHVRPTSPGGDA